MMLLYASTFKLKVYRQRDFDTEFRLHAIQTELHDVAITLIPPNYSDHDTLFVPIRMFDSNIDSTTLQTTAKEDTSSFFSVYTPGSEGLVNSKFISRDLKVITDTSVRLRRPLSNFDQIKAITTNTLQYSSSDTYVVIDFSGAFNCTTLKIFSSGMLTILCNDKQRVVVSNHTAMMDAFDISTIHQIGISDGTALPTAISLSYFCSFYIGAVYIPITADYYFALNSDDASELEIDGTVVTSYYGSHAFASQPQSACTVNLTVGFHTVTVRHQALSGTGGVIAYFRIRESDAWSPLTVEKCLEKGLALYTIPYTDTELQDEGASFFQYPQKFQETNLYHLSMYMPLIFLTRPGSTLLTNDLRQFKFLFIPDAITIPKLHEGDPAYLNDDYTFPYGDVGISTDVDFSEIVKSGITYTFNKPIDVDYIEIKESSKLQSTTYNDSQALTFGFQCRDRTRQLIASTALLEMCDLSNSQNIDKIEVRTGDSVRVTKIQKSSHTILRFKDTTLLTEFNIFPTALTGAVWGYVTSIRAYGTPSNIKTFDRTCKAVNFFESSVESMRNFRFSEISYIPSFFNPQLTPQEIIYNAEYMIYTMEFSGVPPEVEFYGMTYQITNPDNFVSMYNVLTKVDISEFIGRTSINTYNDAHRTIPFEYAFIGFDRQQNETVLTDYSTIGYTVYNNSGGALSNVWLELPTPNLGNGYSGVDGVCAVNLDGSYVTNPLDWDGASVVVKFASLASGTSNITLTIGTFTTDPVEDLAPETVTYLPKLVYFPSILVYTPVLVPLSIQEVTVLLDSVASPSIGNPVLSISDDMTLGMIDITELSGNNATDVQVQADVSEMIFHFGRLVPMVVYDAGFRDVETIYVNKDGTFKNSLHEWDDVRIQFRVNLEGGKTTRFYLRAKNENGTPANFSSSLYPSYVSYALCENAGIRAISRVNSLVDYKTLNGTPMLIFKHTGIDEAIIETL
jgi:hypothetical protein